MDAIWARSRRTHIKPFSAPTIWCRRIIVGLVLLFAALWTNGSVRAEETAVRDILILHSYHHGYKWTDDITAGLGAVLSRSNLPIALHVEYMDTKRVASPDYESELAAFYRKKFQDISFDLIVCSDNNAVTFMATHGRALFPSTPVVFCGFNYLRKEDMADLEGFTGVNEEADLKGGLDLALGLHPDARTVYIINDRTPTGQRVMERLREIIPRFEGRVDFIWLDNLAMPDLIATLRTLQEGALVFYTFLFRDASGRFFEYDESIQMISRNCTVPIYGAWDFNLGHGIVGGLLTSGYHQGEAAGELALRILNGAPVDQVPIIAESPNRYMFDFEKLKMFNIKINRLPTEAIIINQPPSLYQQYRHALWVGLAGLMLQLAIIFFLTMSIIRRRRAEKAIYQSHQRLNRILETANEGFWEVDQNAVSLNVNAELCKILDRTRSEIIGHPIYEFADAGNRLIFENQVAQRQKGERSQYEIALQRPDGSTVHCQFNSSPLYDELGRIAGSFAMVTDISQRKRDEDRIKNREAMLRAIYESTENGIVVVDLNGRISHMNRRFRDLFPTPPIGAESQDVPILKKWLKAHVSHSEIPEILQRSSFATQHEMTSRMRCLNGQIVDVTCYPLQLETRMFEGTVVSFRDITERLKLESQLLQSQKMEALGTLTSGIAHDFNNILAAILGYTEILQYQFKHEPEALKKISRVLKASHRAKALVQQIHSFSRPQQIEPRPLCAGLIVKEVVKLLQASLPANITVQIDKRAKQDSITVDPSQIHQVIMNLFTNAVHAMQKEGGMLTVILDKICLENPKQFLDITLPAGDYFLLKVKDTGYGMPPQIVEKIFDPYFTTKEKGRGTGLGLSVTLSIVKKHGGAIQVDSSEWQGSVFSVYLPLSQYATPTVVEKLPPLLTGTGRILLVDDEPDLAAMMKEMLLHLGYEAVAFTDSQQARSVFEDTPHIFDLAIVDMAMPGLSGQKLAETMREIRPGMPIILCTGYKDRPLTELSQQRLFDEILIKPIELSDLAEILHKALTSSKK